MITWYKSRNGIPLQMLQNSTSVTYETYLPLDEYKCVARNSFGSDEKRLLVNTQSKQLVPFILGYNFVVSHMHV